jgi:hypothetical protein
LRGQREEPILVIHLLAIYFYPQSVSVACLLPAFVRSAVWGDYGSIN